MLLKDKLMLESLTRKYGKNNIINEISQETISNAASKARKLNRRSQAKYFSDEYKRREDLIRQNIENSNIKLSNSSFEEIYNSNYTHVKVFIDKTYPVVIIYKQDEGSLYEDEIIELLFNEEANFLKSDKYKKEYINNFISETNLEFSGNFDYVYTISGEQLKYKNLFVDETIFFEKPAARMWANTVKQINKKIGSNYSEDWHDYYDYE